MRSTADRSQTSASSKSNVVPFRSHCKLRSVPSRDRLSRTVTCQFLELKYWVALHPIKPAPPVIDTFFVRIQPSCPGHGNRPWSKPSFGDVVQAARLSYSGHQIDRGAKHKRPTASINFVAGRHVPH